MLYFIKIWLANIAIFAAFMGRKQRNLPLLEGVQIIDTGSDGKAVGKKDQQIVFVDGLVPGDEATVQVFRKKSNYYLGKVVEITKFSKDRTEPFCSHFEFCGGCKWQNLEYNVQADFKQKHVEDALNRIGKIYPVEMLPILKSNEIKHYRNKLEYTFSNTGWIPEEDFKNGHFDDRRSLGFHIPGRFDKVMNIGNCYLQPDFGNQIRNYVRQMGVELKIPFFDLREQTGILRNLMLRNTLKNQWMVVLAVTEKTEGVIELCTKLKHHFSEIVSLYIVENSKKNDSLDGLIPELFAGKVAINEEFPSFFNSKKVLKYRITPKSFFQTNTIQSIALYRLVAQFANLQKNEIVYDLYSGTGTIGLFIAEGVKKVIGVEYVEEAVEQAKINAQVNEIANAEFFAGDMKDLLTNDFFKTHGNPDTIITDPPRSGMHTDVVESILTARPKKIVYVSCNPSTQARDLAMFKPFYEIAKSQAVDMFPHTSHVENVVLLLLK